jgi:hypothetical protein
MSESIHTLAVSPFPAEKSPTPLTFDERWALWQEKGARHDARVARKLRLVVAALATLGVVWASVVLL